MRKIIILLTVLLLCVTISIGAVQVSAAFTTTPMPANLLVLRADGTVWHLSGTRGSNFTYSQLAGLDNITVLVYSAEYFAGVNDAVCNLALKSDGTVWKIRSVGTGVFNYAAEQIPWLSDVIAVAAGYYASLAVKSDGTVWTWGAATWLFDSANGAPIVSATPMQVPGLSNIVSVDVGMQHAAALKSDGTVWTWGYGLAGQLGRPVPSGWNGDNPGVVSGLADVKAVAAGGHHTLALKNDGTVWGFGLNSDGQLGDGTFIDRVSPVRAQGLSGVRSIALAAQDSNRAAYSAAVKNDDTLWTWGNSPYDTGISGKTNVPRKVVNVDDVAFADGFYGVIKNDGTCWILENMWQILYANGTPFNVHDSLPPVTYTLTLTGGTGGGSFEADETVTIAATAPPSGQRFKQWDISPAVTFTSGTSANSATAKFIMPAGNVTATAVYENITNSPSPPKGIFGTNARYIQWWCYILFFLCFGFIWMWF